MNFCSSFRQVTSAENPMPGLAKDGTLCSLKTLLDQGAITHLQAAESLVDLVHGDIPRFDGESYATHPRRMATRVETDNEKIVRLLHDVVEESRKYNDAKYSQDDRFKALITLDDLRFLGFDEEEVIVPVGQLTREDSFYLNSIMEISKFPIARSVRRHDIQDHLENSPKPEKIHAYEIGDLYLEAVELGEIEPASNIGVFAIERGKFHQPTFDVYYRKPTAKAPEFTPV